MVLTYNAFMPNLKNSRDIGMALCARKDSSQKVSWWSFKKAPVKREVL